MRRSLPVDYQYEPPQAKPVIATPTPTLYFYPTGDPFTYVPFGSVVDAVNAYPTYTVITAHPADATSTHEDGYGAGI